MPTCNSCGRYFSHSEADELIGFCLCGGTLFDCLDNVSDLASDLNDVPIRK